MLLTTFRWLEDENDGTVVSQTSWADVSDNNLDRQAFDDSDTHNDTNNYKTHNNNIEVETHHYENVQKLIGSTTEDLLNVPTRPPLPKLYTGQNNSMPSYIEDVQDIANKRTPETRGEMLQSLDNSIARHNRTYFKYPESPPFKVQFSNYLLSRS